MRVKSQELLALIKKSRAAPKITIAHIEELVADYERMGKTDFFEKVRLGLEAPQRKASKPQKPAHPLTGVLKAAQTRTGMKAADFKKVLLDSIDFQKLNGLKRPAANVSFPKLLDTLTTEMGSEELEALLKGVGERYRAKR